MNVLYRKYYIFFLDSTSTPVTPEQRSHGDPTASKKKNRSPRCAQYDRKHLHSKAVASQVDPVGSQRARTDGTHFEHAQNKHGGYAQLKEHNGVAIWSPLLRSKVSYNAVRPFNLILYIPIFQVFFCLLAIGSLILYIHSTIFSHVGTGLPGLNQ